MEILGVGPVEFFIIIVLAIILLGPKDMAKAGKTIGKWLNDFVKSDTWKLLRDTSNTVSHLPNRLMKEANLDELEQELRNMAGGPTRNYLPRNTPPPPPAVLAAGEVVDNSILIPGPQEPSLVAEPVAAANTVKKSPKPAAKTPARKKTVSKSGKASTASAKKASATKPKVKGKKRSNA